MALQQIQQAIDLGKSAYQNLSAALDKLAAMVGPNREVFDFKRDIPAGPSGVSLERLGAEAMSLSSLLASLTSVPDERAIPDGYLGELVACAEQYRQMSERLFTSVKTLGDAGEISRLAPESFTAEVGGNATDFSNALAQVREKMQELLIRIYRLLALRTAAPLGSNVPIAEAAAARNGQRLNPVDWGCGT